MDKLDLKHNHMIHGLAIGSILYLLTKNVGISAGVGIGAGWYMTRYGHSLPSMEQRKPDHKVPTPHEHNDLRDAHHNHTFNPLHRHMSL